MRYSVLQVRLALQTVVLLLARLAVLKLQSDGAALEKTLSDAEAARDDISVLQVRPKTLQTALLLASEIGRLEASQ